MKFIIPSLCIMVFISFTITAQQNVGIGTTMPEAKLDILAEGDGMKILQLSSERPWVFKQRLSGTVTRLSLQSTVDIKAFEILSADGLNRAAEFNTNNVQSKVLLVPDDGHVGIGQVIGENPDGKLHIAENSGLGYPQIRLTEIGYDFARIKFENNVRPGAFWDIAGRADTVMENAKLNFFYFGPNGTGDRMTITGNGNVGIGVTNPEAWLDMSGGNWNLDAGDAGDLRIGNVNNNLRIGVATGGGGAGTVRMYAKGGYLRLGTENTTHLYITTAGDVGIGTDTPGAKLSVLNPDPGEKAVYAELTALNQNNISMHSKVLGPNGTAVFGQTTNTSGGIGLHGEVAGVSGTAVYGHGLPSADSAIGVHGEIESENGYALFAESTSPSGQNYGMFSTNASNEGVGIYSICTSPTGGTTSIYGWNFSTNGMAVRGIASANTGDNVGVSGTTYSDDGIGTFGSAISETGFTVGVYGSTVSGNGTGVYGEADGPSGTTYGVRGNSVSPDGTGVYGHATASTGDNRGVYGNTNSDEGTGVYGIANNTTGETKGVHGRIYSINGTGVRGDAIANTGVNFGVYGRSSSSSGRGVYGEAASTSGVTYGVYGVSYTAGGAVFGQNLGTSGSAPGVRGESGATSGVGVEGVANATSGMNYGVFGSASGATGRGVYGTTSGQFARSVYGYSTGESAYGLYGYSTGQYGKGVRVEITSSHSSANAILAVSGGGSSYAGYFVGNVHVAGTLSKNSGSFKIDHPLDPENKYLYHSFVESPDMMNIYNGNITTDGSGYAEVQMPEYFNALNMEFRYQLTVIGEFAQAIISEKIQGNQFSIRTDKPNIEVSWQVTGIRKDPWAQQNRIETEVMKETENRGRYISPEVYNQPEEKRINFTVHQGGDDE